jgi:hypothetical protein
VAYPSLWVAGYVTVWYQRFWLKQRVGMGWVCWSESRGRDRILTVKLKSSGGMTLHKSTQEIECQGSFVRVRRIVTVPFEFRSDRHCGIKRDPGSLDHRVGEQGSSDESEEKVKSTPSDPIGERDQRPGGIVGNQVARDLISQGGPAIQTTVSPRGYMSASEELWGERRVTPNHRCAPPQIERH